ncbi:MAG TPA: hypothetical protein PKW80_15835 [Bacteroidales bacterium]|nr:hypothetical protein [Bacteroidales bacterium]
MKHPLLFIILLQLPVLVNAQAFTIDTIAIERRLLTADLSYQGKDLSAMKLEDLCQPYADATDEFRMAKRNTTPALLLTLAGAVMIGYSGIKWLTGDDFQWYYAAGGVVMIGATIPLYLGARNHSINAARIYNYEMKHKSSAPR